MLTDGPFSIQTLLPADLLRADVILFAAVIGLLFSRWWRVLIAAFALAIFEYAILYGFAAMIFGPNAPGAKLSTSPKLYATDITATVIAFLIWAMVFFGLKILGKHLIGRFRSTS